MTQKCSSVTKTTFRGVPILCVVVAQPGMRSDPNVRLICYYISRRADNPNGENLRTG